MIPDIQVSRCIYTPRTHTYMCPYIQIYVHICTSHTHMKIEKTLKEKEEGRNT